MALDWRTDLSELLARHTRQATETITVLWRWDASREYDHAFVALARLATDQTKILTDQGTKIIPLREAVTNLTRDQFDPIVVARSLLAGAVAVGGGSPESWPAWRHMVDYGQPIRPSGGPGPSHAVPGIDTPTTTRRLYAQLVGLHPPHQKLGTATRGNAATLQATFGAPKEFWGFAAPPT